MGTLTKIAWCDATLSPWEGCTPVSPGCAHCYAAARDRRHLIEDVDHWGKGAPRRRVNGFDLAARALNRKAETGKLKAEGRRLRVFPSLCDWLDPEVPVEWLADFLRVVWTTPNVNWLLLTKRPELWLKRMGDVYDFTGWTWLMQWRDGLAVEHLWIGMSAEDQDRLKERVLPFQHIPSRGKKFLSLEPLLGPINIKASVTVMNGLRLFSPADWVIVGGETGPGARPCNVSWIRDVVRQCKAVGVPCFVKQLGANIVDRNDAGFEGDPGDWPMDTHTTELDSGYQGAPVRVKLHDRAGADLAEWPEDLRVRETPKG